MNQRFTTIPAPGHWVSLKNQTDFFELKSYTHTVRKKDDIEPIDITTKTIRMINGIKKTSVSNSPEIWDLTFAGQYGKIYTIRFTFVDDLMSPIAPDNVLQEVRIIHSFSSIPMGVRYIHEIQSLVAILPIHPHDFAINHP